MLAENRIADRGTFDDIQAGGAASQRGGAETWTAHQQARTLHDDLTAVVGQAGRARRRSALHASLCGIF